MLQYQFLTLQRLWSVSSSRKKSLAVMEQDKMLFDERQLDLQFAEGWKCLCGKVCKCQHGETEGCTLLHKALSGFRHFDIY